MSAPVMLCADSETVRRPDAIGLSGERLDAQPWLSVFENGAQARAQGRNDDRCDEAWIVSSDDVDSINLAAALKRDTPRRRVFLVSFQNSGSLRSRASAAGIDGVLDRVQFTERYSRRKQDAARRGAFPRAGSTTPADEEFLRELALAEASAQGGRSRREGAPSGKGPLPAASGTREESGPSPRSLPEDGHSGRSSLPNARPARSGGSRQAFVLVVASASGGSGKSTVATLSAVFAQGMGYRTLLVDADLQFGDVKAMLGARGPRTLDEAAAGAPLPSAEEGDLPALLAAPARLEDSERLAAALPAVIEQAGSSFDVVVVNTGPFWGEQHAVLAECASRVIFLVDQRSSSLGACKHALELCGRCGIPTTPFLYAVNRCKRGAPLSSIDVSCALQGAPVAELRDGGRAVDELLSAGLPLDLVRDENPLCVSLEGLLAEMLPEPRDGGSPAHAAAAEAGKSRRPGAISRLRRRMACRC